jgi:hypothetical protein
MEEEVTDRERFAVMTTQHQFVKQGPGAASKTVLTRFSRLRWISWANSTSEDGFESESTRPAAAQFNAKRGYRYTPKVQGGLAWFASCSLSAL